MSRKISEVVSSVVGSVLASLRVVGTMMSFMPVVSPGLVEFGPEK